MIVSVQGGRMIDPQIATGQMNAAARDMRKI
jgi:hypothetical protein